METNLSIAYFFWRVEYVFCFSSTQNVLINPIVSVLKNLIFNLYYKSQIFVRDLCAYCPNLTFGKENMKNIETNLIFSQCSPPFLFFIVIIELFPREIKVSPGTYCSLNSHLYFKYKLIFIHLSRNTSTLYGKHWLQDYGEHCT